MTDTARPSVLFVCVHNAGRSQMAAGFLRALAGDEVEVRSAGSVPADQVNPVAVAAMAEVGIDIADQHPTLLTAGASQASDVVVTMGCGDVCPTFPGQRHEDWDLPDPAGQDIETVRAIRDQIRDRVNTLLDELGVGTHGTGADDVRATVREHYAKAATQGTGQSGGCCGPAASSCCGPSASAVTKQVFGGSLYGTDLGLVPVGASDVSLGCGNPVAVAELNPGQTVLDLGSGGGIDVLLSARRVGPEGFVYGVDMTDEMLELARKNATDAGATNVEFRKGTIEDVPLDDACVDVVISNCVINLSPDKAAVFAEVFRVLRPGGRVGISDVVAEDHLNSAQRAERGDYTGCIAGALSKTEYLDLLADAGFADTSVTFTHSVADAMHGAIVRAVKPAQG